MNKKIFLEADQVVAVSAQIRTYDWSLSILEHNGSARISAGCHDVEEINSSIKTIEGLINLAAELKQNLEAKKDELEGVGTPKTRIKHEIRSRLYASEILDQVAAKNKVTPNKIKEWVTTENPEIVRIYNARLIAELLNVRIHEVWE